MSWQIDSAHSLVEFSVRHMMISTVRGRFEKFDGLVDFYENDPTNAVIDIEIDVTSINTNEPQRDGHLRSADFFDVANYPTINFKSTRVEKVDNGHGRIIGDLTIKDITKEVVLDVTYAGVAKSPWGGSSVGASATTAINREDWGLTWNQTLETGGVLVGKEIKIAIELELVKQELAVAEAVV